MTAFVTEVIMAYIKNSNSSCPDVLQITPKRFSYHSLTDVGAANMESNAHEVGVAAVG